MRAGGEGVTVGLRFEGLGASESSILGKFLSDRDPGIAFGFPRKRRLHGLKEDEVKVLQAPGPPEPVPLIEPAEGDDSAEPEPPEALTDGERLKRIRKRGKKILLVMGDELERITLLARLQHEGYRSLFEAHSLVQALELQRRWPLDLLLVDQTVGHVTALKLVDVLRENALPKETRVVVIQKSVDHQLTLARKGGKLHLVVERPLDFDGALKQPLEALLGIS
jgi:CheY-like chemotaxis protein